MSNAIWGNYPSFRIDCKECKQPFRPRTLAMGSEGVCEMCGGGEWSEPAPTVEVPFAEIPCKLDVEFGCGCEPCPIDIRTRGYKTRKEDPYFENTECLWHEVIIGRGEEVFICVSGGTPEEPERGQRSEVNQGYGRLMRLEYCV